MAGSITKCLTTSNQLLLCIELSHSADAANKALFDVFYDSINLCF